MTLSTCPLPFLKKLLLVSTLALCGSVQAAPRRVVVASGDCKDAELSTQTKAFHDALLSRQEENVLTATDFEERLFPQPSGSFEDIQRQLDAAQGQFYEARYTRAAQTLEEVLRQVARLPVGEARWKLYVDAQLLRALNQRATGQVEASDEAFRNVLRLAPDYTLDPDYYTPSTRQAFEKLRRELARSPKVKLSVKSTLPASEVFLDGLGLGQTPLTVEVPAGTYELSLQNGDALSFPRQLLVQGQETPLLVDLAFEGAVTASPFPCIAATGEEETVLSHAVRLGGTLGVEEVIVVRLERASSGPKWLAATVLNVEGGQKLREGGFKTRQGLDAPAESLEALVDFVTTGKARPSLVVLHPNGQASWEGATEDRAALTPEHSETRPTPGSGTVRPLRIASYAALGVGAAALGAAGVVRLSAEQDLKKLQGRLNANGNINATDRQGQVLLQTLVQKNNLMLGLLLGGGGALATGAVLYVLSPAKPPPVSVGLTASPDGAAATVSGTF
ncbi:MAG TPA: PEGA domain-containing protein [Myxococcaceae bacterium]|nr:PEGA domain-containing protein [Myxococcaceae bacterium]